MPPASTIGTGRAGLVLVTGFEPFGGQPVNPSGMVAQALNGQVIDGHPIVAAQLPTVFGRSIDVLLDCLERFDPVLVLCCGQAGGRGAICLERVAINIDDARIPDNAGAQPVDTPVVRAGPAAYFTRLPIKAMRQALLAAGINAEVSQTAGTFVCNHVFFGLMHALAQPHRAGVRGGFVHLPWLPQQGQPSMPLDEMVKGLRIVIGCALATRQDIRQPAGALD